MTQPRSRAKNTRSQLRHRNFPSNASVNGAPNRGTGFVNLQKVLKVCGSAPESVRNNIFNVCTFIGFGINFSLCWTKAIPTSICNVRIFQRSFHISAAVLGNSFSQLVTWPFTSLSRRCVARVSSFVVVVVVATLEVEDRLRAFIQTVRSYSCVLQKPRKTFDVRNEQLEV